MSVGLGIASIGAYGFLAAAEYQSYAAFLGSLFVLAMGITLVQVAANPLVTLLGKPETASSRLTMVGAFNSLGTTLAPLVGAALILSQTTVESVQKPYMVLGTALLILSIGVSFVKFPEFKNESEDEVTWSELFKNKRLMLGAGGIFAYVGAEVAIGSFLVSWLGDAQVLSLTPQVAGGFVSFYWGGAMVGRFIGTPLLVKFKPERVLFVFVLAAAAAIALSMATGGHIAQWAMLSIGLFNSIGFPTIFSESLVGLKKGTEKASGILCAAIIGGAIIPLFQGILADQISLRWSFVLPILCYGYLAYFAKKLESKNA